MKTKLEQLAVELRSLAVGVEAVQPDLDSRDSTIEKLEKTLATKEERMQELIVSYNELRAKDAWKAVSAETPKLDLEVITRDANGNHRIATYEGTAGWFSGNTRLSSTPKIWFAIPKR